MTLVVVSAFLLLCIVIKPILGVFSEAIFSVILGVFGIVAYPCLIATLVLGILILTRRYGNNKNIPLRVKVCIPILTVCLLIISQLASTHHFLNDTFSGYIGNVYSAKYSVGGVIVGTVAFGLKAAITEIACYVVFSVGVIVTLLVMTSAISKIRERIHNRRTPQAPPEPVAPTHSMLSDDEAQRVVYMGPRGGLFVDRIEPAHPEYAMESGLATEAPVSEKRAVSDYPPNHVMDGRGVAPDNDENRNMARFRLYGDTGEVTRQRTEEFRASSAGTRNPEPPRTYTAPQQPSYASAAYSGEPAVAEPFERVNSDAQNPDKPVRSDFDGNKLGSIADLFFPAEKDIQFNDAGIETAEEKSSHRRQAEFERATAPIFDTHDRAVSREYVEPIINASAPVAQTVQPVQPAKPQSPIIGDIQSSPLEDRFLSAFADDRASAVGSVPPLETERFKQEDIIDAYEVRDRFVASPEEPASVEDDALDDIVIASNAPDTYDVFQAPTSDAFVDPVKDDFDIIGDDDGIITSLSPTAGGSSSLTISDAPAIDMTETHDNVSDLISGDDMSGIYLSADSEKQQPVAAGSKNASSKRANKTAPLENQMTIDGVLRDIANESVVGEIGKRYKKYTNYAPPPVALLKAYPKHEPDQEELQAKAETLKSVICGFMPAQTRAQLAEQVKVLEVIPGPQVTLYEMEIPSGFRVNIIESRAADIAYELASNGGVRIQAPIPGKRAVGIEVPNASKSFVGLSEIVDSPVFTKSKSPLVFAVGKDISGNVITCDLDKAPHFLIAGQTGSGKSAGLNSLIVSLLYKSSPEDVRFVLIDPKRVEFSKFRGMPHLLFEKTISEPNDALNALKWAADEMNKRYTIMQKYSCSKIAEYNNRPDVVNGTLNKLPHIVIIIDELATLMQSAVSGEIESKISSIAALARAAGIHLIVATQRPSADVVTGTIKANLGSRIAFKVPDATNSRIILDEIGAEALTGDGDMLFFPQDYNASKRVQGSFVSGEEVLSVVNWLKERYECDFDEEAERAVCGGGNGDGGGSGGSGGGEGGSTLDPLAPRVLAHGIKTKQLSVSVVQRRFSIGYARAARIIDTLEEKGYIGPSTGNSKPRDVIMTSEDYRNEFGHDIDDC